MDLSDYQGYRENKSHSDASFPYNTYPCTIPLDFREVPLHWHDETELIVVKKGQGIISLDMVDLPCKEGEFVLVLPGHIHGIRQEGRAKMEYENIIFDASLLLPKRQDLSGDLISAFFQNDHDPILLHVDEKYSWHGNAELIIEETDLLCSQKAPGYQIGVRGNLLRLFYLLVTGIPQKPRRSERQYLEKMKDLLAYVEANYQNPITIADAANAVGYSESHFMKFFKAAMGVTFISWLDDYRLSIAARMLLLSTDSVLTVSQETGFRNLSYFNRLFRAKFHMTPREYRKGGQANA